MRLKVPPYARDCSDNRKVEGELSAGYTVTSVNEEYSDACIYVAIDRSDGLNRPARY